MPTPQPDESRDEFIERCVPIVLRDGTADGTTQAFAICNSIWEQRDKGGRTMEKKTFSAKVINTNEKTGIVDTIFAVFGNVDAGNDMIHPGAFTKTFAERGNKILVLDQHNTDSIMRSLGKPILFREIGRDELPPELLLEHPDATGGAFARVQFNMKTDEGRGAFHRLDAGDISKWSFGYDTLDFDFSKITKNGQEITLRNLRALKLYEISPVLFAMNEATTTTAAKGVTGATDLPLASRDREWDASAAQSRVRSWAGADDEPNAKYRRAFFWFDGNAPDQFGSYKLQFADVIDGTLTAVPRGLFAVAGVLSGARGGVDIPQSDQDAIKGRVGTYYGKMRSEFDDDNIVPPWDKAAGDSNEGKTGRVLAARNARRITSAVASLIEALDDAGIELEGFTRQPQVQEPENDGKTAPDERAAQGAGPETPTLADEAERLKLLLKIAQQI